MRTPGVLVLSEVFYPAWKAYVDGEERPILEGRRHLTSRGTERGSACRGVPLPQHTAGDGGADIAARPAHRRGNQRELVDRPRAMSALLTPRAGTLRGR